MIGASKYLASIFEKFGSYPDKSASIDMRFTKPDIENAINCGTNTMDELKSTLTTTYHEELGSVVIDGLLPCTEFLNYIAPWSEKARVRARQNIGVPLLQVKVTDSNAVVPFKSWMHDVGYDLTLIKKVKDIRHNVIMYDTGIQVKPTDGYYTEVVPRSSLVKTGWVLANSTGIIDRDYRGNIMVVVARIDKYAPDLEMPFRGFQLVIRKQHYIQLDVLGNSEDWENADCVVRGARGFGSTG